MYEMKEGIKREKWQEQNEQHWIKKVGGEYDRKGRRVKEVKRKGMKG